MTTTDWIQAISTLVLVIVTIVYAKRTSDIASATRKQADATKQQAEASMEMADEMRNATAPFITIKWMGADPNSRKISAILENEGFGPALNLKCYLSYKEVDFNYKFCGYTTFKVGQKYTLSLPSGDFDFKAWSGLCINCDYESVLGEKFRSILKCESEQNRSFNRIKLNSGEGK